MSRIAVLFAVFALATGAWAAEEAVCGSEIHAAIERDLRLADFAERAREEGFIVSQACKTWPYKPALTLVALAYKTGAGNVAEVEDSAQWAIILALFDKERKRIINSDQWQIQEDASVAIDEHSLGFDTARYQLAEGVRAFGLRFHSTARGANCPDFDWGNHLTLLIPEGKSFRQVLHLFRHAARSIEGCLNAPTSFGDNVNHYANLSIGVEKTQTNGFFDLRIAATIDEGGKRKKHEHVIFRYDGKHYAPVGENPWWLPVQYYLPPRP